MKILTGAWKTWFDQEEFHKVFSEKLTNGVCAWCERNKEQKMKIFIGPWKTWFDLEVFFWKINDWSMCLTLKK